MKKLLFFCVALWIVACNRHIDSNSLNAENRGAKNQTETREELFSVLSEVYQADYLSVKSHLRKEKKANAQEYYTKEGHRLYYEVVGAAKVASKSDEAGLLAQHQKIQNILSTASNLPDYQRLVIAASTELVASRLLNASTEAEKSLLVFYTKSLVAEQCTNYFLLYETFKKLKNINYNNQEIKQMAVKTLQLNDSQVQNAALPNEEKEREFALKMKQQNDYIAGYKKKIEEFV